MNDDNNRGKHSSYLPRTWGTPAHKNLSSSVQPSPDEGDDLPLDPGPGELQADGSGSGYEENTIWESATERSDPESQHSMGVASQCGHSTGSRDMAGLIQGQCPGSHEPLATPDDERIPASAEDLSESSMKISVMVCGIRFGYAGRIYHFETGGIELTEGDWVIVKTEKGVGLGHIVVAPFEKKFEPNQLEGLRKVVRKAGKVDFDQKDRCLQREGEALAFCSEKIEELGLAMKLISAECFFDGSKYIFYFTAEGRVDFRELVKQLVVRFPVRIEMRQIGVRHEAKMLGGLASCGQELCCSRFLTDFHPVSVRMAKTQNLSLNPSKISGVCGRLMCCLGYEHEAYEDCKKCMPKVGKSVRTSKGLGIVLKLNPLAHVVFLKLDDDTVVEIGLDDILVESSSLSQPGASLTEEIHEWRNDSLSDSETNEH